MTVDPFFRRPFRLTKGLGDKCTTCEIVDPCSDGGKCILPLVCGTIDSYSYDLPEGCDEPLFVNADLMTGAVYYDCELHGFDFSILCGYEVIDLLVTYEIIYDVQYAVLRSYALGLEVMVEFGQQQNARCPNFDFGILSTRPYPMVSIGQQKAIGNAPDDCTAGRCLPEVLCLDMWTAEQPDLPLKTELTWYESSVVEINDVCCCNANTFPEILIARVVNFSSGCTCIGPQRVGTIYYPAEHAGAELTDSGALIHLKHEIAGAYSWPDLVTSGSNVWASIGDLVQLCPAPNQPITAYTRTIMGRMILWCDIADGKFKAAFETVDIDGANAASDTDYQTPFNEYSAFSTITIMDSVDVLCCNPFSVRCKGVHEDQNCQDLDSVDGTGDLEIVVSEFEGWAGPHPVGYGWITLYSERVNVVGAAQTLASDCYPKIHFGDEESLKARDDKFYINKPWPLPVWDGMSLAINQLIEGYNVQTIDIYPRPCAGCELVVVDDDGPITTPCCDVDLPRTLHITSAEDNDCPCADGTVFELTYSNATSSWTGGGTFGEYCSCEVAFELLCRRVTGGHAWELNVSFDGVPFATYTPGEPENQSYTCNPLEWVTKILSNNSCCNPSFAASLFHWIITL